MNSPELKEISILCKKILSKIVIGINKSLKKYHPKRVIQGGSNISKPTNKLPDKSSPNNIDNYEQVQNEQVQNEQVQNEQVQNEQVHNEQVHNEQVQNEQVQIGLLLKIVQASYKILMYFVNRFLAMISNIVRENKQKIADVVKILKNITNNSQAMNDIKLISQLSSRISFQLLNILEPEFDPIIKRINFSMKKISRDMGSGIGTSMWTFAGTFIEAIPFWGFFINMFITIGSTLNTASRIYRSSTIINLPIIEDAANTIERVKALINKYKKDIHDMINLIASYGNNNTLAEQKIRYELNKNVETSLNAFKNKYNNILEEKKKYIANISNIANIELQNDKNPITLPIQRLKPIKMGGKNKSKNIKKYKIICENRLVKTLKRFINPII